MKELIGLWKNQRWFRFQVLWWIFGFTTISIITKFVLKLPTDFPWNWWSQETLWKGLIFVALGIIWILGIVVGHEKFSQSLARERDLERLKWYRGRTKQG